MIIKFSNSDGASIDKTVYDNKSTLRKRILFLSLLISFIMPMRIIDITKYSPIDNKCKKFYGIVEQIRVLRYSREVVIRFREVDKRSHQYKNISNMAVCYIYNKMAIKPKDEIIIFTRPDEIRLNREKQTYFESTLLRKGIRFIFYLNEKNFKIAKSASVSFKQRIRNSINDNLSSLFDINATGVLKALYFGNKNYIDKLTIYEFKRAGALHVLAASGLHVGIISALPLFLLGAFRINRKIVLIVISLVVLFYLYITDMPVSLMRAFIMLLVFSVQRFFEMDTGAAKQEGTGNGNLLEGVFACRPGP